MPPVPRQCASFFFELDGIQDDETARGRSWACHACGKGLHAALLFIPAGVGLLEFFLCCRGTCAGGKADGTPQRCILQNKARLGRGDPFTRQLKGAPLPQRQTTRPKSAFFSRTPRGLRGGGGIVRGAGIAYINSLRCGTDVERAVSAGSS